MPNDAFHIEEEFDPSLLGFGEIHCGNASASQHIEKRINEGQPDSIDEDRNEYSNTSLKNVTNDIIPNPNSIPPARPLTALDLLRAITESYQVDSSPLSSQPSNFSNGSPISEGSLGTSPLPSETIVNGPHEEHEEPIIKDFADQDETTIDPGNDTLSETHIPGYDLEKTDLFMTTVTDVPDTASAKLRSDIRLVRTRLPGSKRYRTAIRVYRTRPSLSEAVDTEGTGDETNETTSESSLPIPLEPIRPEPNTQFQRDLSSVLPNADGEEILDKIKHKSKLDATTGNNLPSILGDLFPALSDLQMTLKIVNFFRRQFDLPLLDYSSIANSRNKNNNKVRIELKRSIAKMREHLYIELISALILPLAPMPPVKPAGGRGAETDEDLGNTTANTNTDIETEEEKVTLTPINLKIMEIKLPTVFPLEKNLIKQFLRDEHKYAYGEKLGNVIWQGGIGKVRGKGEEGFRGKCEVDGNTHIFVDHSNILHGLIQHLYANPSSALPPRHLRTLSLPALSLLLRRGRYTPPGSLHLVASSPLQQNLDPLVRLGWEISVLKRVELYHDEIEDPTSLKIVNKVQNKISNFNDLSMGSTRRFKEQGVDEILHLKILQILNEKSNLIKSKDNNNTNGKNSGVNTLVLATGDARDGQFNKDGFPGAVREALKRGWNVELWSFTSGLSRAWRDIAKREKWYELGKFTIWGMDDWAEQLVEVGREDFI